MRIEKIKIQRALKSQMKKRKLTYKSLGAGLKISPATVKRRLNGIDISINQILEMASALNLSFYELIEQSKMEGSHVHLFTHEQENLLSEDLKHIFIFRLILMGKGLNEIQRAVSFRESDLRKIMRKFEDVGLALLTAGERITPLVTFPFKWQPKGRLDQAYSKYVLKMIFRQISSDCGSAGLNKKFEIALTPELYEAFCKDIHGIYLKYQNISQVILSSSIDPSQIVSGLFFIDRFSCWEEHVTKKF